MTAYIKRNIIFSSTLGGLTIGYLIHWSFGIVLSIVGFLLAIYYLNNNSNYDDFLDDEYNESNDFGITLKVLPDVEEKNISEPLGVEDKDVFDWPVFASWEEAKNLRVRDYEVVKQNDLTKFIQFESVSMHHGVTDLQNTEPSLPTINFAPHPSKFLFEERVFHQGLMQKNLRHHPKYTAERFQKMHAIKTRMIYLINHDKVDESLLKEIRKSQSLEEEKQQEF